MKCRIGRHLIRVCAVWYNKIDLQRKRYIILEILICDPSIYTMGIPGLLHVTLMKILLVS